MEEFYGLLQNTTNEIRETNSHVIVMGAGNSKIGRDKDKGAGYVVGEGENTMNRNEEKII